MSIREIDDVDRLKRINDALVSRVERSMDQQGNAFSLFQTAINLEGRVRKHTEELRSAMRRLEQTNVELAAAKELAEQANISKTRFLAAASHDVLQPLNAAHLSVSALADLQTSNEGRKLVSQVERALSTMEDLLRTLLDISRLDAGVMRPEIGEVHLGDIFQSLESDFQPLSKQLRLRLRFRPTNVVVRSDRTMLRRILQNVISNAIRYTETGGVIVGARMRGDAVLVNVADTGIGIPADQLDIIYEEFRRASNAGDAERGATGAGLGLGLAIVRRLVATLSHELKISSCLGKGTVFSLTVPRLRSAEQPKPLGERLQPQRGYGLFGMRVLVIENDEPVMHAMEALLGRWHCAVRSAATAGRALELLDGEWVPDLIIADQHLDHGDLGSDTIRRLRSKVGRHVPALLVTADPSPELAAEARRSGIEMMHKPVKPAELRALMAHMLA
ncbi:MAG: hybrid sensor histidine kinase/response regulator [Mesorhizobium sp.]